jgi:hypothetical protein
MKFEKLILLYYQPIFANFLNFLRKLVLWIKIRNAIKNIKPWNFWYFLIPRTFFKGHNSSRNSSPSSPKADYDGFERLYA